MKVNVNKSRSIWATLVALFVVLTMGCSPVQKALKSGDIEIIYTTAVDYYQNEEWSKSITLFESVSPYYMGTEREDSLRFFYARAKFKNREYEGAIELFDAFRKKFGRSSFLEDCEGMYTLSHYYLSPAPTRDQTITQLAINKIDEFMSRYPSSEHLEDFKMMKQDLMERLHEKDYLNAYTYFKVGRYKSAITAFRNALKRYPESARREDIMLHILLSCNELAVNSIESKQQERYLATIDAYYSFVAEFPESEHKSRAEKIFKATQKAIGKSADEDDK